MSSRSCYSSWSPGCSAGCGPISGARRRGNLFGSAPSPTPPSQVRKRPVPRDSRGDPRPPHGRPGGLRALSRLLPAHRSALQRPAPSYRFAPRIPRRPGHAAPYRIIQHDMNNIFTDPYVVNRVVRLRIANRVLSSVWSGTSKRRSRPWRALPPNSTPPWSAPCTAGRGSPRCSCRSPSSSPPDWCCCPGAPCGVVSCSPWRR